MRMLPLHRLVLWTQRLRAQVFNTAEADPRIVFAGAAHVTTLSVCCRFLLRHASNPGPHLGLQQAQDSVCCRLLRYALSCCAGRFEARWYGFYTNALQATST